MREWPRNFWKHLEIVGYYFDHVFMSSKMPARQLNRPKAKLNLSGFFSLHSLNQWSDLKFYLKTNFSILNVPPAIPEFHYQNRAIQTCLILATLKLALNA